MEKTVSKLKLEDKEVLVEYTKQLVYMQSYPGMIIHNNISESESSKLKEIFGDHTTWEYLGKDDDGFSVWHRTK